MAGSQILIMANQVEAQRLGYQAISLTNYDNTSEPQIAAGSVVEIGDALFEFSALESITGWSGIANNSDVYIKLTVSGASVTASFTITAPTWDTAKQGWYSGAERYAGGLRKDSSGNYTAKWLYDGQNDKTIGTAQIRDSAVTTDKIAAASILASKIDVGFDAGGSQVITVGSDWTPAAGIYLWAVNIAGGIYMQIYQGGAWRGAAGSSIGDFGNVLITDGVKVRIHNGRSDISATVYYLKML